MPIKPTKKEPVQKAKGMHDILPKEYLLRKKFVEKAAAIAFFYGFKPVRTPILEKEELFTTTLGETTDIVEKEMYNLKTKGGDKLVLRPEGTAPMTRLYIEHGLHTKPQPVMLYYEGSFFRHENPQKGRRREFEQLGLEILGETDPITDATIIKTFLVILEEAAGLKPITLRINSVGCKNCRKAYLKELTTYLRKKSSYLCKNCNRRIKTNPLRILDCKEESCAKIKEEAPQIINYLCDPCKNHFKETLEVLDSSEIPYYIDHYLVRGLDYYSRTAFELTIEDDSLVLVGGGRYDSLAKMLGGKDIPAVGAALGVDRVIEKMKEKGKDDLEKKKPKVFFIQLGNEAKFKSLKILEILRKAKIPVRHSLTKNSMRGQLNLAGKTKAPYALIFGQKESLDNSIIVKNVETASQETVPLSNLAEYLKKKL
ncbi:MAG: histidine--tRNA ligase [Candidatus Pacebacteria bacterium]|nr:histidine--tRNA ligase [Candidatus Paceibacterota bacterium]